MKHRISSVAVLACWALVTTSLPIARAGSLPPLPSDEISYSINVVDLKKHLGFLASDELGGRHTLSPSSRIAARYLATQLESYGYRGAGPGGSFFQEIPLSFRSIDLPSSRISLLIGGGRHDFKYGDDFNAMPPTPVDVSGELVFVGYGISSPSNKHDDYSGLDVRGKIVVTTPGFPTLLAGVKLGDHEYGNGAALAHGATCAIVLASAQQLMLWDQLKNSTTLDEQLGLRPRGVKSEQVFPTINAGPRMIKALAKAMGKEESYLLSPSGKPLNPAVIPARAEVRVKVSVRDAPTAQNVAGILEGSDPGLKDEFVIFSAHYDHLPTSAAGEIYNGADDDGSGTAAVLEIAQAFAMGPKSRRSILIVFHTAEELGLFGSEFNVDYEPVVPLDKLVANFNIDMIGRSRDRNNTDSRDKMLTDKDSIYIIGSDKLSTELHRINEQTNNETARMRFDYTYNPESHPERFYYRSDHYNYAKHGIPVIFYFTGVHRDYHQPTDDIDKIDFRKMERITRLIFATGWRVANLDHRPLIDKKPPM